jgi:hypothetical protein
VRRKESVVCAHGSIYEQKESRTESKDKQATKGIKKRTKKISNKRSRGSGERQMLVRRRGKG